MSLADKLASKLNKLSHGTSRLIVRDSYRYAASTMIGFIALVMSFALYDNTYATSSSITVTIDDNIVDLNVAPTANGTFSKSSASKIGVSTTNYTGYTLSISAQDKDNPTALVNGDKSLPSIENAITEDQSKALDSTAYNNMWGYLPSNLCKTTITGGLSSTTCTANTNFLPSPTTDGDILDITSVANSTVNEYEITLGARVDSTASLGSYSNTFLIAAVANAVPYTITFVDNVVTDMPVDMSGTSDIDTVTISTNTPQRNGYNFIGWCTVAPTHNADGIDTCPSPGVQIAAGGTVPLDQTSSNNNFTLYAMWGNNYTIDGVTYMQDFATMSAEKKAKVLMSMVEGQRYELKDNRDQEMYYVAKLKDGNVWMLDNLRLGGNFAIDLSPNNTNIINAFTLPANDNWSRTYIAAKIVTNYKNDTNVTNYGDGSGKVGTYYNYCALSAGTYCSQTGSGVEQISFDICPKSWQIPTSGPDSIYQNLCSIYYGAQCPVDTHIPAETTNMNSLRHDLSITLTGYYNGDPIAGFNDRAHILSSSLNEGSRAYIFGTNSTLFFLETADRGYGRPARCILK